MFKCIRCIQLLLLVTIMFVSNALANQPYYNDGFESYSGTDGLAGATCFYMVFNHLGDHGAYTKADCVTEVDLSAKLTTVTSSSGVAQLINGGSTAGTSWSQLKGAADSLFQGDCEKKYNVELNSTFTEYNDSAGEEERRIRLQRITEHYLNNNQPVIIHMMRYWYYPGTYVVLTGHENGRVYYARSNGVTGDVSTEEFIKEKWYDPNLSTKARWDGEWMGFYSTVMKPGDYRFQFSHLSHGTSYTRFYNMHVPNGYDGKTAVPLILNFHGVLQNAGVQQRISEMNAVADKPEGTFIVIYPEATQFLSSGMGNMWNSDISPNLVMFYNHAYEANVDDVDYALELVNRAKLKANIDPDRVYVTGLSQGAGMALKCILEHPEVFAAASVASGLVFANNADFYDRHTPVPIQAFYTHNDPLSNEGLFEDIDDIFDQIGIELYPGFDSEDFQAVSNVEQSMKRWAVANGCCVDDECAPQEKQICPDGDPDCINSTDPNNISKLWNQCENEVELLKMEGTTKYVDDPGPFMALIGGHDIYTYRDEDGNIENQNTKKAYNISEMQWEFLKRFPPSE